MELSCENAPPVHEATDEAIRKAFLDDEARGSFIILSESDQVYLQAAGSGNGPHILEHRDGDATRHFQCLRNLDRSEVQSVFLKYLRRDGAWKTDFQWSALEATPGGKPRWKFW